MMFDNPYEVHKWLDEVSQEKRFYMRLLNIGWQYKPETEKHYLGVLGKLAEELTIYPFIVRDLIRHYDWRINLVGNVVAILQQKSEFEQDLAEKILVGSWVEPQLAAGFTLLTSGKCVSQLENFLKKIKTDDFKYIKSGLSVYAALRILNSDVADRFAKKPIFNKLQLQDRDGCASRTQNYYNYWKNLQSV